MREASCKGCRLIWMAHQAPLSMDVSTETVLAVPDPLSTERDGLVVFLPVEHGWGHAYDATLQSHRVALGNTTVLEFLQDHGCFLHLFG